MHYALFFTIAFATASVLAAPFNSTLDRRDEVDFDVAPWDFEHCPGRSIGDADGCTFEKQNDLGTQRRWFMYGSPVANCGGSGNVPDLVTTVGGQYSATETWETTSKVEISVPGIKVGGSAGWSESETVTGSQSIAITVKPGRQAVAVVGVNQIVSQGQMRFNYGDPVGLKGQNDYHFIWYYGPILSFQPTSDDIVFDHLEISCGEAFHL
ncbi:hypothetical protein VNI00_008697 [Paramarasmius palmivorus]|uniref:Uncharacterized protein n=1 Tax=Paramarasmius palmivorus TaxID=297713 RepID=A0AAW0CXL3_9AGAR